MEIIFQLSEINFDIYPDLKIYSENISHNIDEIKEFFIREYTIGPFTPKVTIDNNIVIINIDTESYDKYINEFNKATQLADLKKYEESKEILSKLINKNPTVSDFYRVYGQILECQGKIEEAKNYLIDSLKWNPNNKYALLMMGNIFARHYNDIETANIYHNKVLSIDPNDHIALNNIGGNLANLGKYDDALRYFELAVNINDTYPNTHYGLALIYNKNGEYLKSFESATKSIKLSYQNNNELYQQSESLAFNSAFEFVKNDKNITEIIQNYKKKIQNECGTEIKIEESNTIDFPARTQYAENHNRNYHLILFKRNTPAFQHLIMHELSHIDLANQAKKIGKNKLFATDNSHIKLFIRNSEKQISALNKSGLPEKNITDFINSLFNGLSTQIFNAPIDLFIEDFLYNKYPENRPYQFFALQSFQKTYIESSKNKDIIKFAPKFVRDANIIYNLIHAFQFYELFGLDFTTQYSDLILYKALSRKFYNQFLDYNEHKNPGDEYILINKWGKELKLDKYFKIIEKSDEKISDNYLTDLIEKIKKDPLNIDKSKRKNAIHRLSFKDDPAGSMAVTMYCLEALILFQGKENDFIQQVSSEIALLGTYGFNPYDNQKKYTLKSIPDKQFTALELLSFEYVGFKKVFPELDTQLDFENEYERAKQMHKKE
jgi:tetratricopeptide (TPR) repeat protein